SFAKKDGVWGGIGNPSPLSHASGERGSTKCGDEVRCENAKSALLRENELLCPSRNFLNKDGDRRDTTLSCPLSSIRSRTRCCNGCRDRIHPVRSSKIRREIGRSRYIVSLHFCPIWESDIILPLRSSPSFALGV